jgi:RNA polymerase sigma factor (sigma-70 family)
MSVSRVVGSAATGLTGSGPGDPFLMAYGLAHERTVRLALALTADIGVAEEVAQEAWVAAYRRHLSVGIDAPEPYVRRAVVNMVRNRARRGAVERSYLRLLRREAPGDAALSSAGPVGARLEMVELLQRLPQRMRTVVVLRFYSDLSVAETAAAMGVTEGTVKSTTSKALARLRDIWEEDQDV